MFRTTSKSGAPLVPFEVSEKMHLRAVRAASHYCPDLVCPEIASALKWFADEYRTKESSVLMSLMATTATVCAGHVVLKTHEELTHHVTPALMMLNIGSPGSGKSPAIDKFCTQPLTTIGSLTQRKFYDRPANNSSFRNLIKETEGKCSIIGDKFNRVLTELTSGPGGDESIGFINNGWSGGRISIKYTKAASFDLPDSCITLFGAIHPPTIANMIRTWKGGEGLKERWLFSVVADDTPDARTNLNHKLNKTEAPFDVEATFMALYQFCREQVDLHNIYLSPDALERYLALSEEISELKKRRRENILDKNLGYSPPSSSKEEEMILKVTLVFHVLENALISYKATGMIDIPPYIPVRTMERAISYVKTSNKVLQLFSNENAATTQEAEMLLIPGKLLIPQLVSEATRHRNKFPFADPKVFAKVAKALEKGGLGEFKEVKYKKTKHSNTIVTDVYFKSPPGDNLIAALAGHGLMLPDYDEAYNASYNIRASQNGHLGLITRILERNDPFKETVNNDEIISDRESSEDESDAITSAATAAKKRKPNALAMHSPAHSGNSSEN